MWRNGRRTGLKILRRQLRVGSSPTTRTKRPKRSFLFGGTFVLCTTNAKAFGTHTVWLAPVSPCPSAESSSHLTARPTTRTKRPKRVFFVWWDFCALHNKCKSIWNPHRVAGARLPLPVCGVKFSLDCTSHHPHQKT